MQASGETALQGMVLIGKPGGLESQWLAVLLEGWGRATSPGQLKSTKNLKKTRAYLVTGV